MVNVQNSEQVVFIVPLQIILHQAMYVKFGIYSVCIAEWQTNAIIKHNASSFQLLHMRIPQQNILRTEKAQLRWLREEIYRPDYIFKNAIPIPCNYIPFTKHKITCLIWWPCFDDNDLGYIFRTKIILLQLFTTGIKLFNVQKWAFCVLLSWLKHCKYDILFLYPNFAVVVLKYRPDDTSILY